MSATSIDDLQAAAKAAKRAWITATFAWHEAVKAASAIQPGDVLTRKSGKRALVKTLLVDADGHIELLGVFALKTRWSTIERRLYDGEWANAFVSKADRETP